MRVTIGVKGRSVVHKDSSRIKLTAPDVSKTPTPGGPVLIPYPNIAKSGDTDKGTKKVPYLHCHIRIQRRYKQYEHGKQNAELMLANNKNTPLTPEPIVMSALNLKAEKNEHVSLLRYANAIIQSFVFFVYFAVQILHHAPHD